MKRLPFLHQAQPSPPPAAHPPAPPPPVPSDLLDHVPIGFGQYKDKTPAQVAEEDPSYLVWASENIPRKLCSEALLRECQREVREAITSKHGHLSDYLND